jgi:translocation protein SEC72
MATAPPQAPSGHAHPHPHPPRPGQPGIRPPPGMMMGPSPPPNPALQAILDAIPHINVPFSIQEGTIPNSNPPQTTTMVTCDAHKQVICKICDIHFGPINYMFNFLKGAPAEAIPPPPNAPTQPQRAEAIKQAKEAGNVCSLIHT